ncbi:MAG: carboxypeptidase-like regulatory domain-containing protein, partial [Bacteroidota bacterium]
MVFFFALSILNAQQGIIKGSIVDEISNEPLIGATVVIEGTTKGASADLDGNYTIKDLERSEE